MSDVITLGDLIANPELIERLRHPEPPRRDDWIDAVGEEIERCPIHCGRKIEEVRG